MDQASINNVDADYRLQGKVGAGLPMQGNVVHGRTKERLQVQGRTYNAVSQKKLAIWNIKIPYPKCLPTHYVMAPKNDA